LENDLNKRFVEIHNLIQSGNDNLLSEYQSIKNELECIEKHKARGVIFRSKCKWAEEGEKCTAFFLRLEKQNFCNKFISQLEIDGKKIQDAKEILKAEKDYYNSLYSEQKVDRDVFQQNCDMFVKNENIPKISEEDRNQCETEVSESEILASLKVMKNGKSPGSDGLTTEFYKFFWRDIKVPLVESIRYSLIKGELSIEQKRGIITLIPKKEKNRLFLKNWRPISLLNVDYNILAKCLASRLCKVLPHIIDEDQTGYVKGRFIGCNIRQIEDIIIHSELNKTPGIILTIDFEKAFDSVNWNFIDKSLEAFNLGPTFRGFIKTLYKNISSTVINNGKISDWFSPKRGVRQGCPISPYLFIMAVELLAIGIRENKNIKGIEVNGSILKVTQLADDTTCFVQDIPSLKEILLMFKSFELCAGLKMNTDKTKAKFIGSLKDSVDAPLDLDWSDPNVNCLGITLSGNEDDHYRLNYQKRILNLRNTLNRWKCRRLSLKGKITVINNLALPPLLYVASVIHTPDIVISEVKKCIRDFIWDGKPAKIAYDVIIQPIEKGGLKLMDFEAKVKALKAIWVKRFLDSSTYRWKAAPTCFYNTLDINLFFLANHAPISISPKFYREVHNCWSEARAINTSNINIETIQEQVIWNNRYITISNKSFCWSNWIKKGIMSIKDILNNNNQFMTYIEINKKFNVNCNFLHALQIRKSIPSEWRTILYNETKKKSDMSNVLFIDDKPYISDTLSTKVIYNTLIKNKVKEPACIAKWTGIYPNFHTASADLWPNIFKIPFYITRETWLQTFQYKLIHNLITCQKNVLT
jgi:hypothetical protein